MIYYCKTCRTASLESCDHPNIVAQQFQVHGDLGAIYACEPEPEPAPEPMRSGAEIEQQAIADPPNGENLDD